MQDNERGTILEAQQGDAEAFARLVDEYQRAVYNLCYRMTGNALDAEDAAQETFLRAFKSIRRYDPSRPFSTWILSIAAHYCIDQARRRRFPVVSVEELPVPDLPDSSPGIEKILSIKEDQQRVHKLLQALEPIDRAAVIMYYWYDFSYQEISQTLSLTESAVKSRLHRARRTMAEAWQADHSPKPGARKISLSPEAIISERMAP